MPTTPSRTNRPVVITAVIGIVGAILTWAFATQFIGLFIFVMLGVAIALTIIQNKNRAALTKCPHCGYDISGLPKTTEKCPECGGLLA